ncbi:hypothetical protein Pelo_16397 [Pelomyxa schiedti]|nr:hypothetical protein Pelo_16397 [Pelomyxa schiedti]
MLEIDVTASIDDGRDHGREVVIPSTSAGGVDDNKKEGGGAAIMGGAGASTAAGDHYLLKVDKTLATAHVAAAQRERSNSATVGGVCVANCGNCARCGNAKLSRENRSICDVRERVEPRSASISDPGFAAVDLSGPASVRRDYSGPRPVYFLNDAGAGGNVANTDVYERIRDLL